MFKSLLVMVLKKISVRLEIEDMQLREVKKDLMTSSIFLKMVFLHVLVITVQSEWALTEAKLDDTPREKWFDIRS